MFRLLRRRSSAKKSPARRGSTIRPQVERLEDRTAPSATPTTLSGTVFNDLNGSGQQTGSDPALAGRAVQLYTDTAGQISAAPLQTTTTDANGNYAFTGLAPLPAGTDYVLADVPPAGWGQTSPAANTANTVRLPDGRLGYEVSGAGGQPITLPDGSATKLDGPGTATVTFNLNTPATVTFLNGQGQSQSVQTFLTPLNVTYTDAAGNTATFPSLCIDLTHDVTSGQNYQS
jgi:hypothetical protein